MSYDEDEVGFGMSDDSDLDEPLEIPDEEMGGIGTDEPEEKEEDPDDQYH